MNKAIKYRLHPTKEQQIMFAKTFGCCRKVWNCMLSDKISHYEATGEMLMTRPAQYKGAHPFLKQVDSLALCNEQLALQKAFSNFLAKRTGFPKYKSAKHDHKSYTTNNNNNNVRIVGSSIKLPKIGFVKMTLHRQPELDWRLKSVTVSQEPDGKYYASVLFEYDADVESIPVSDNVIGLDYKSDGLYMDNNGNTADMPKFYRKSQKHLAKLQRRLSRKKKASKNRKKQQIKVAKLQKHTANQRLDFLHKKSTEIANRYDVVCVESLNMRNIANKKRKLGKATLDNGYGMFLQMLQYKLADRGKHFVKIDKWYPSSQLCSCCGQRHHEMKDLSVRLLVCDCGYTNDRDINAAINIRNEGLRLLQTA